MTRWLTDPVQDVPHEIYVALVSSLFGTIPIFIGGVANTILTSALIAARHPTPAFLAWLSFEIVVGFVRTVLVTRAFRASAQRRETPTDVYIVLALVWALGVGAGSFMCLLSGDWVIATLACLSSSAMMGGICFRNFAAPRLAIAMIVLSFGPLCLGGVLSGEPILLLTAVQIPFYLFAMGKAVYWLNGMLVASMRAERDNDFKARHDLLTGLPNRRYLWETGQAVSHRQMVFAIMDIDHFKAVNDTFGHSVGDVVLQTVGRVMVAQLSSLGMVGRLGGEEFALVSPSTSAEQIAVALSELARAVEEVSVAPGGVSVRVTLSAGVALRAAGQSFDDVYKAADEALYRAKRSGRNRIEVFEPETISAPTHPRVLPQEVLH